MAWMNYMSMILSGSDSISKSMEGISCMGPKVWGVEMVGDYHPTPPHVQAATLVVARTIRSWSRMRRRKRRRYYSLFTYFV